MQSSLGRRNIARDARALRPLLKETSWVNVRKRGANSAVGDNSNDDAGAIQAAIDALNNGKGGTVYFPLGTYRIASTLNLYSNIRLVGERSDGTGDGVEIRPSAETVTGITVSGQQINWGIENITVNYTTATSAARATNAAAIGLKVTDAASVFAYEFDVRNFRVYYAYRGVQMDCDAFMFTFYNCLFQEIGNYGFHYTADNAGTTATFINCYVDKATTGGFSITGIKDVTLINCACDNVDSTDNINLFSSCTGSIHGFFQESCTISAASKALMNLSNSIMLVSDWRGSSNDYDPGAGNEAYGIRVGESNGSVTLIACSNESDTETSGTAWTVMPHSGANATYIINCNFSAPTGGTDVYRSSDNFWEMNQDGILLPVFTSAPGTITNGLIVYADAASWDPGSGTGVYARVSGSWNKAA